MEATELQNRLASLAPGETLLLPAAEVEHAFHTYATAEERRIAAAKISRPVSCRGKGGTGQPDPRKGRSLQPRGSKELAGAATSGAASLREDTGRSRTPKFVLDCDSFATFEARS
jgi:hypothetical protein